MKKLLGIREDVSKIPTEKHLETSQKNILKPPDVFLHVSANTFINNFAIYIYLYFRKHLFFQKKRFYFKKKQYLCIENKNTNFVFTSKNIKSKK